MPIFQLCLEEEEVWRCTLAWAKQRAGVTQPTAHWTEEERARVCLHLAPLMQHIRLLLIGERHHVLIFGFTTITFTSYLSGWRRIFQIECQLNASESFFKDFINLSLSITFVVFTRMLSIIYISCCLHYNTMYIIQYISLNTSTAGISL